MNQWFADVAERYPVSRRVLHWSGIALATVAFMCATTILVVDGKLLVGVNNPDLLLGMIASEDIRAPQSFGPYESAVLTERKRQEIRSTVPDVYSPPDPMIARQQVDGVVQILAAIDAIRTDAQLDDAAKTQAIAKLGGLNLHEAAIALLLAFDDALWRDVSDQVTTVLERVMRGEVRQGNIRTVQSQLPNQVSLRFNQEQTDLIVDLIEDWIVPNSFIDLGATEAAREAAATLVQPVEVSFATGQTIVLAGQRVDDAIYEALQVQGLLEPHGVDLLHLGRAFLTTVLMTVFLGLYLYRFRPNLFNSSRTLLGFGVIFLIFLVGARLFGAYGQIYLFPTAALSLLFVALDSVQLAMGATFALGVLVGVMQDGSLEMTLLVTISGALAAMRLQRAERLTSFFWPGQFAALSNLMVIAIFYQNGPSPSARLSGIEVIMYTLINGVLSGVMPLGLMYIVNLFFNLPTTLKLIELSQPTQPLLQRLLREAPGTYQHSLQVANLAEQAAEKVGANAELTRVAAMYHDIGKMENPAFFVENQAEGVNPLNAIDNYARRAEIIINHVTDGLEMARQYRLPPRIRDFIAEHHGKQVVYFYDKALQEAADKETVDRTSFVYPGPEPRSRETGILMLADSCEAAARSRKPSKRQDVIDTVDSIFASKVKEGRLNHSGLTLGDLQIIRQVFIDLLQALYHPRLPYPGSDAPRTTAEIRALLPSDVNKTATASLALAVEARESGVVPRVATAEFQKVILPPAPVSPPDPPMLDVPPLPRSHKAHTNGNGTLTPPTPLPEVTPPPSEKG